MRRTSLLLLSDIHFGKYADSPDFVNDPSILQHQLRCSVPMKQALIDKLKGEAFDGILVLGDITSVGSPSEFVGCTKVLKEIGDALGISPNKIFHSFGNHDLDWSISKLADGKEDDLYHKVAASVGSLFVDVNTNLQTNGPLPGSGYYETEKYCLYILNSGYFSVHNQVYKHGRLGKEQMDWLKKIMASADTRKWRIVMLHHHPFNYPYPTPIEDISCIQEGADLVELMGDKGIDIVCHGHRHHPRLHTELKSEWHSPITFISAGSLSVNPMFRNKGEIPNCFHILHLEERVNEAAIGELHTFKYSSSEGWIPARYEPSLPLDDVRKFGILSTRVERISAARKVIEENDQKCELPIKSNLSEALQCTSLSELNSVFEQAAIDLGGKKIGKYPNEVMVIREGDAN